MRKRPQLVVEFGDYSIQWLEKSPGRCDICGLTVGCGPVGFTNARVPAPVCDPCLMQRQPGLGTLLLLANITRELAEADVDEPERCRDALTAIANFYHRQESFTWPMRPLGVLEFLDRHAKEFEDITLDDILEPARGKRRNE
jgi:hypothetical protein